MAKRYKNEWLKKGMRLEELKTNKLIEEATNCKCLSVEQLIEECKKEVWQGLIVGFLVGIVFSTLIVILAEVMR